MFQRLREDHAEFLVKRLHRYCEAKSLSDYKNESDGVTESEVETRRVKVSSENISSYSLSNNGKQCGNRYGGYRKSQKQKQRSVF